LASNTEQLEMEFFPTISGDNGRSLCGESVYTYTVQKICKESKTLSFRFEEELDVGSPTDVKFRSPIENVIAVTNLSPNSTILTVKWSEGWFTDFMIRENFQQVQKV